MSRDELSCVKKGVKSRDRSRLNCNPKQGKGALGRNCLTIQASKFSSNFQLLLIILVSDFLTKFETKEHCHRNQLFQLKTTSLTVMILSPTAIVSSSAATLPGTMQLIWLVLSTLIPSSEKKKQVSSN